MRTKLLFFLLVSYVAARAQPITSGVADLVPSGPFGADESFTLNGPGFTFTGGGFNTEYTCGPAWRPCVPGSTIPSASATLSSDDRGVGGTITVGSTSFRYTENEDSPGSASLHFQFDLTIPSTNPPAGTLSLTGPFTATAFFQDPSFLSGAAFRFEGEGLLTLNLNLVGASYALENMHFDFSPEPPAIPEPATGALTGIALGVLSLGVRAARAKRTVLAERNQ